MRPVLWAALALALKPATPIPAPEALAGIRADLYRFEIHLREEDDSTWRVTRATWRRVSEPGAARNG